MILSFGCSHSCGSYDEKDFCLRRDAPRSNDKVKPPYENLYRELGDDWPSEVHRNSNEKHFHISMSGHGILSYYEALKVFEENGLLQSVDKLLIQHTHELRMVTGTNPNDLHKHICNILVPEFESNTEDFVFHNVILGPVINISHAGSIIEHIDVFTDKKASSDQKLFLLETMTNLMASLSYTHNNKNIFNLALLEIKRICERNNIKYYDFAWDSNSSYNIGPLTNHFKEVTTIGEDEFMIIKKTIGDEQYWAYTNPMGGHFMKEGTDVANKLIINHLRTTSIFT